MTDPSLRRPADHLHLPAHRQLRRQRGRRWSPSARGRARRSCARPCNREDAPSAERGWLDWLTDCGVPAITGVDTRALVRHIRDAGAMRGGVFPARSPRARGARADRRRAADGRAGPRARSSRPAAVSRHGDGDGPRIAVIDTGIKALDGARARRARRARRRCTRARARAEELLASDPDAVFLANGPGDPAALDYVVDTVRELVGKQAGVGHLPRPPAALPRGRPGDVQAAVRPPRREPPGQGPADGPRRDHLPEPRLRGRSAPAARARSTPTSPCAGRPTSAPPQLSHVNLYDRTVEGLELLDVPGGDGPVPPRGRARARTTRSTCSTASSSGSRLPPDAAARRHPQDPDPRLGADRDRPGGRVRLLRRAGLQGAARGGLRGRARQLEPGDDHDRPGVRRRDLRRAAAARAGRAGDRARAPRRAAADARRADRAEPGQGAARRRHARALRRRADRRELRGDRLRRGPRAVPRDDGRRAGLRMPRSAIATTRSSEARDGAADDLGLPCDRAPGVHARRARRRHRAHARGVRAHRRARPRGLADRPGAARRVGDRLGRVRARGDARPRRQRRDRLLDREHRPDGRAHGRLGHRRPAADAHRPPLPAAARPGDRRDPRGRRRDRRLQRAVRRQPGDRGDPRDRDEPARLALLGAGLEGDRLPDREDRRAPGGRLHAGGDRQRHHRRHARLLRADDRLRGREVAALRLREVPRRRRRRSRRT